MSDKLISVVVMSYCSEVTILETLQSIYNQTYKKIELVITDDCSKDNTIDCINEWIDSYGKRFVNVVLVTSDVNTGVSQNLNRGIAKCEGEWIKIIAADDVLLPNCLEDLYGCAVKDSFSIKIYQSNEEVINGDGEHIGDLRDESLRMRKFSKMPSAAEQYNYLLLDDIRLTPTLFFEKKAFEEVGGCDERIRNIEDYPLKLRFLRNGYRMGYCDTTTVQYRIHDSISHRKDQVYSEAHLKQKRLLKNLCCNPYISKWKLSYWLSESLEHFKEDVVIKVFKNKRTFGAKVFMKILYYLIPREWERRLLKMKDNK